MDNNKVKYGLSKCYYSVLTEENDEISYGTPVAFPGSVNVSFSREGSDPEAFRADNIDYWMSGYTNSGYTGTYEFARIIDSFYTDVLGYMIDDNGNLVEVAGVTPKEFALMFQFEGDKNATRYALYRCTASRPDLASQTTEETITPITETLDIKAIPVTYNNLQIVKNRAVVGDANYDSWFTAVQLPVFTNSPADTGNEEDPAGA